MPPGWESDGELTNSPDHLLLLALAWRLVALGAPVRVLGAGRLHVYAFERSQARKPGEDVGELLFEIGSVAFAQSSGEFAGFLDQPAKRAVPAATTVFVEIDVTDAPLELGDCQRVSIAKKRGESSTPLNRHSMRLTWSTGGVSWR